MPQAVPVLEFLLVMVGVVCIVLEFKVHGTYVFAAIGAICFIIFFWLQLQFGGPLIHFAIAMFILGLALVGVELFVAPGHGVTGVAGALLMLAGLALAGLTDVPETVDEWTELVSLLLRYGVAMSAAVILAFTLAQYLPDMPYVNRLVLVPLAAEDDCQLPGAAAAAAMLGQTGTAKSMLGLAGKAIFNDRLVDVMTQGEFVPPGAPIQVIAVEGTRIVVKRV